MKRSLTIINTSPLFQGASSEARQALARRSQVQMLKKRDRLFLEGEIGNTLYLQITGKAGMLKTAPDGQQVCVRVIGPGDLYAVVTLFGQAPYPVTAEALEDSEVLALPAESVRKLLDEPAFRDPFIAALIERQRYLAEQVRRLALDPVEHRLISFLRDHYGEHECITATMTKKDVAAALGVAPETFSRLLKRLAREGDVTWTGRQIKVARAAWRS